jgi:hypothetical protein
MPVVTFSGTMRDFTTSAKKRNTDAKAKRNRLHALRAKDQDPSVAFDPSAVRGM